MHGNGWWPMAWPMFGMAMWWILLLLLIFAVWYFASGKGSGSAAPPETPEEILKKRYAKGEIDRDTYEKMLADLRK